MDFVVEETPTPKKVNSLWVEKYRPDTLDGYIGNESIKEKVRKMVSEKDIPHLLLFGPAGTGKTTLAKMLVNNIPCDYMYVNASDQTKIEFIRENIKPFAMGAGFKPLKVVILDEADYLSQNSQASLRNMLESYSANTRFIMTCNYPEKMLPAIVSRCQTFEIKPISKNEVAKKLMYILTEEKVKFTKEDIIFCVSTYYPDIRKVINFAQQSKDGDSINICKENAVELDSLNKLIEILQNPKDSNAFSEVRKIAADVDPNTFDTIYKYLFDKVDLFAKDKEALVILELADAVNNSALVIPAVRDITFVACIQKIMKHLK